MKTETSCVNLIRENLRLCSRKSRRKGLHLYSSTIRKRNEIKSTNRSSVECNTNKRDMVFKNVQFYSRNISNDIDENTCNTFEDIISAGENIGDVSVGAAVYMTGVLSYIIARTFNKVVDYSRRHRALITDQVSKITDVDIIGGIHGDPELNRLFVRFLDHAECSNGLSAANIGMRAPVGEITWGPVGEIRSKDSGLDNCCHGKLLTFKEKCVKCCPMNYGLLFKLCILVAMLCWSTIFL